jgi:hypothetical protein
MRKVIFRLKKTTRKNGGAVLFFVVFGLGLVGCNATRESICQDFPVADEVDNLQIQIADLDARVHPSRSSKRSGRRIASVSAQAPGSEEIQNHREEWMEWGEKALKRTQWAKDALENDKQGRKAVPELNTAGLSLVSFHGYLEQGKWKKAKRELDQVEKSFKRVRKIACEARPVPAKKGKKARN